MKLRNISILHPRNRNEKIILCSQESDICLQKTITFSGVLLMYFIQLNCFCVADTHGFIMIPANTENKFRIQS